MPDAEFEVPTDRGELVIVGDKPDFDAVGDALGKPKFTKNMLDLQGSGKDRCEKLVIGTTRVLHGPAHVLSNGHAKPNAK